MTQRILRGKRSHVLANIRDWLPLADAFEIQWLRYAYECKQGSLRGWENMLREIRNEWPVVPAIQILPAEWPLVQADTLTMQVLMPRKLGARVYTATVLPRHPDCYHLAVLLRKLERISNHYWQ